MTFTSASTDSGVYSDGFIDGVAHAQCWGQLFTEIIIGQFHGPIAPTAERTVNFAVVSPSSTGWSGFKGGSSAQPRRTCADLEAGIRTVEWFALFARKQPARGSAAASMASAAAAAAHCAFPHSLAQSFCASRAQWLVHIFWGTSRRNADDHRWLVLPSPDSATMELSRNRRYRTRHDVLLIS